MNTQLFFDQFKKLFPAHKETLEEEVFENLPYLQIGSIARIINVMDISLNSLEIENIFIFIDDSIKKADMELKNILHVGFLEHLDKNKKLYDAMPASLKVEYDKVTTYNRQLQSDDELKLKIKKFLDDSENFI